MVKNKFYENPTYIFYCFCGASWHRDTDRAVCSRLDTQLPGGCPGSCVALYAFQDGIRPKAECMVCAADGYPALCIWSGIPAVMGILRPIWDHEQAAQDHHRNRILCN